jgi:hypothetical protein
MARTITIIIKIRSKTPKTIAAISPSDSRISSEINHIHITSDGLCLEKYLAFLCESFDLVILCSIRKEHGVGIDCWVLKVVVYLFFASLLKTVF